MLFRALDALIKPGDQADTSHMGTSGHGMLGVPKRSVHIDWQAIDNGYDPRWDWSRVLYAYLAHGRLLYIGKAEETTVMERLRAPDKERHLDRLASALTKNDPVALV